MKKCITAVLAVLSVFGLTACRNESVVLAESKTYEISSDIHSLEIQVDAAEFTIEHGDEFSVESNLKNLTVSDKDGVLSIVEETVFSSNYTNAELKLCIPDDVVFDDVDVKTGASALTADYLFADSMELKLGAGKVEFGSLTANSDINIKGGAGEIAVLSGSLNDLNLEIGVGKLDLTAALTGKSNLQFGVGESELTLLGSREDYSLDIEKGLGNISVDGKNVSDFNDDKYAENYVKIVGGVGATSVTFQEK